MSKEFKAGDKVRVLVDAPRGQFLKGCIYEVHSVYEENGRSRIMVVADSNGNINGWLADNFELVESFDDLIDVAVQATADEIINVDFLSSTEIVLHQRNLPNAEFKRYSNENAEDGINFIKSLYTETFVIESLADVERIKLKAKFSQNGFEYEIDQSKLNNLLDCKLFLLKGATVTQKIENK